MSTNVEPEEVQAILDLFSNRENARGPADVSQRDFRQPLRMAPESLAKLDGRVQKARGAVERSLHDVRDMEIAWLYWNIMTTMYPALIAIWTVLPASNLIGAAYLLGFNVLYMQRFILAMHYSTHKRLFKKEAFFGLADYVNRFNIVIVAPVFGIPCNTYWLHHVVMHHVDNNEWNKDLSATEAYQRDNFAHWIIECGPSAS